MLIGLVIEVKLPFDFVINDRSCTSLVRIRRLKYSHYGISNIMRSYGQEIARDALALLETGHHLGKHLYTERKDLYDRTTGSY